MVGLSCIQFFWDFLNFFNFSKPLTKKTSMVQAAEKVIPKKDGVKRKSWMTNEVLQHMLERKNHKGTEKYRARQGNQTYVCRTEGSMVVE